MSDLENRTVRVTGIPSNSCHQSCSPAYHPQKHIFRLRLAASKPSQTARVPRSADPRHSLWADDRSDLAVQIGRAAKKRRQKVRVQWCLCPAYRFVPSVPFIGQRTGLFSRSYIAPKNLMKEKKCFRANRRFPENTFRLIKIRSLLNCILNRQNEPFLAKIKSRSPDRRLRAPQHTCAEYGQTDHHCGRRRPSMGSLSRQSDGSGAFILHKYVS